MRMPPSCSPAARRSSPCRLGDDDRRRPGRPARAVAGRCAGGWSAQQGCARCSGVAAPASGAQAAPAGAARGVGAAAARLAAGRCGDEPGVGAGVDRRGADANGWPRAPGRARVARGLWSGRGVTVCGSCWPRPSCCAVGTTTVVTVDAIAKRVVARRRLAGGLARVAASPDGPVLLLGLSALIGPSDKACDRRRRRRGRAGAARRRIGRADADGARAVGRARTHAGVGGRLARAARLRGVLAPVRPRGGPAATARERSSARGSKLRWRTGCGSSWSPPLRRRPGRAGSEMPRGSGLNLLRPRATTAMLSGARTAASRVSEGRPVCTSSTRVTGACERSTSGPSPSSPRQGCC